MDAEAFYHTGGRLVTTRWPGVDRVPVAVLFCYVAVVGIAGGASREDTLGQAVVRVAAAAVIAALVIAKTRLRIGEVRAVAALLAAMAVLVVVQLIPLPPAIWVALPGHKPFASLPALAGLPPVWRPIDLVPDGGVNALAALVVPTATLLLLSALGRQGQRVVLPMLLAWIVGDAFLGMLQASGGAPDNPFVNGIPAEMAGAFANRNHQALFLAVGIFLMPCWSFAGRPRWRDARSWLAILAMLLFALLILATGSRSGVVLGVLALVGGLGVAFMPGDPDRTGTVTRKSMLTVTALAILAILAVATAGHYAGRMTSLNRFATMSAEDDIRLQSLPTSVALARSFFPVGSGLGSFDPVFRAAEPFSLLRLTYLNHAHNDYLEILIEAGIAGVLLLTIAIAWYIRRTLAAFRSRGKDAFQARIGAGIIFLVLVASLSDYPARTPAIMMLLVMAACWLERAFVLRR